jgi:hypothetical protein
VLTSPYFVEGEHVSAGVGFGVGPDQGLFLPHLCSNDYLYIDGPECVFVYKCPHYSVSSSKCQ